MTDKPIRKRKTTADLKAKMEALKVEIKRVEEREAIELGKMCIEAGWSLTPDNKERVLQALKDGAARFPEVRQQTPKNEKASRSAHPAESPVGG